MATPLDLSYAEPSLLEILHAYVDDGTLRLVDPSSAHLLPKIKDVLESEYPTYDGEPEFEGNAMEDVNRLSDTLLEEDDSEGTQRLIELLRLRLSQRFEKIRPYLIANS